MGLNAERVFSTGAGADGVPPFVEVCGVTALRVQAKVEKDRANTRARTDIRFIMAAFLEQKDPKPNPTR